MIGSPFLQGVIAWIKSLLKSDKSDFTTYNTVDTVLTTPQKTEISHTLKQNNMSIFSDLADFFGLKSIVDLFISNFNSFVAKLKTKIAPELAAKIDDVIQLVNSIKDSTSNPTVAFIISLIPASAGGIFIGWVEKNLPVIAAGLGLLENELLNLGKTPAEVIKNVIGLSNALTASFTNMSIAQAAVTVQVVYADNAAPIPVTTTPITNTPETVINDPATGLA